MAVVETDLHRVAQGGKNDLFMYTTDDALSVITAALGTYFTVPNTPMRVGDIILAACNVDGTPEMQHYVVQSQAATTGVTVVVAQTIA